MLAGPVDYVVWLGALALVGVLVRLVWFIGPKLIGLIVVGLICAPLFLPLLAEVWLFFWK